MNNWLLTESTSINAAKGSTVVGWAMFGVGCLAWLFIIFILYTAVTNASATKLAPIRAGLTRLKLFIVFGWAIYPLGFLITLVSNSPDVRVGRELIYNFADLFNKVVSACWLFSPSARWFANTSCAKPWRNCKRTLFQTLSNRVKR